MKQLHIALAYAENGISVFPCNKNTKRPVTTNGFKNATTDEKKIRTWWGRHPDALIGSPNTTHTVLDIDLGKAAPGTDMLTHNVMMDFLERCGNRNVMLSKTKSGGFHVFFKFTPDIKRKIFILPNMDILGEGGFVILPDQKTYVSEFDEPWNHIQKLDEMPYDIIMEMADEYYDSTVMAFNIKNGRVGEDGEPVKSQRKKETKKKPSKSPQKELSKKALESIIEKMNETPAIDYRSGKLYIPQTPKMYEEAEVAQSDLVDPTKSLLVDGQLRIKNGTLDSKMIAELFYNEEIQRKLGKFLGLKVPVGKHWDDNTSMRSVFPTHRDLKPSMGVRWHSNGTHLIVRDFANHFGDPLGQHDYNIVRLYATIRYGCQAPRLKPPEFVVWFLRLLVDAGLLDVSHNIKKYKMPSGSGSEGFKKIGEDLKLLDAIKQLYSGYNNETAFSDRFGAAWCNAVPGAVNFAKKYLVDAGLVSVVGVVDCSGGKRTDGFYNTNIYRIVDDSFCEEMKENKQKEKQESMNILKDKKEEKLMSNRSDNIVTMKGVRVSEDTYNTVVNFCEDFDIPNVPLRENMFVESGIIQGTINEPVTMQGTTYFMDELEIVITPSFSGGNVMMVTGAAEALNELFWQNKQKYEFSDLSDEPNIGFVISTDVGDGEYDLGLLESRLSDYLGGAASFDEVFSKTMRSQDVFSYLDGMSPADFD